ncbi:MAG: TolC family protein, partial [Bryobacteraceae bacterium]
MPPFVLLAALFVSDELSADDAVALALTNNTALAAAAAELGIAQAELAGAGVLRNLSFQALFPVGPKPFESVLQAPIEAIWQRRRRIAAAKVNLEAVAKTIVQAGLDLARDVKRAHLGLAHAERRAAIARESAELRHRIADLTDRRLAAGDIGEMEAGLARLEARSAEDSAQR